MGQFRTGRVRVRLEIAHRGHQEARHAERALEALLIDHALLHRMQRAVGGRQSLDGENLLAAHRVCEDRAGVARHIVDEDGTGATLRTVAPQLGAGEPQLVAQRHGQRFLLQHVDAPVLSVDIQRDQALDAAGRRRLLAEHRR